MLGREKKALSPHQECGRQGALVSRKILHHPSLAFLAKKGVRKKMEKANRKGKEKVGEGTKENWPENSYHIFSLARFPAGSADNPTYFPGNLRSMTQFRAKMKILFGIFFLLKLELY